MSSTKKSTFRYFVLIIKAERCVQAFVHVAHQMLSQLSPHCSSNIAAYNL